MYNLFLEATELNIINSEGFYDTKNIEQTLLACLASSTPFSDKSESYQPQNKFF
jgi:hypothetical protein